VQNGAGRAQAEGPAGGGRRLHPSPVPERLRGVDGRPAGEGAGGAQGLSVQPAILDGGGLHGDEGEDRPMGGRGLTVLAMAFGVVGGAALGGAAQASGPAWVSPWYV